MVIACATPNHNNARKRPMRATIRPPANEPTMVATSPNPLLMAPMSVLEKPIDFRNGVASDSANASPSL